MIVSWARVWVEWSRSWQRRGFGCARVGRASGAGGVTRWVRVSAVQKADMG